jgi:hypothetical protein
MLALRTLVEAAGVTRDFLVPFGARRYAALAAVAAFVGVRAGYGSVTNVVGVVLFGGAVSGTDAAVGFLAGSVDAVVVGALAVVLAAYTSAVAEFVLVDVLRSGGVRRGFARGRLGEGARLFLFRSVATASFGASALFAFLGDSVGVLVAVGIFAVVVSLVNGFTTDFVVPVVVVREGSLSDGWRRVARLVRRRPRAFAAYAVVRVAVSVVVALGATVAAVLVAVVYAVPFGVASYALGLTSEGLSALPATGAGVVLLVGAAVVYVALVAASVALVVQLPVRLFVRSWSLLFLGEIDGEYAVLRDESLGT